MKHIHYPIFQIACCLEMEFGARFIGWFDIDAIDQIEFGKLAEKYGFNCCWFPHDTFMRNTWVLTSALAMETRKIKLASVGTNLHV